MTSATGKRDDGKLSYEQRWFSAYGAPGDDYRARFEATFGAPRACNCASAYDCTHREADRPLPRARIHW